ncbi:MAG: hypothetical protein K8T25_13665 [Planctomycetia bacterium]|nr:hypothetical protein [Planctomycetia bacterium]
MHRIRLASLLTLLCVMVAGCDRGSDVQGMPEGSKPVVDVQAGKAKVTVGGDGVKKIDVGGFKVEYGGAQGTKLPADLPADIPIFAGASVQMQALNSEATSGMIQLQVKSPIDKVGDFYKQQLPKLGWTVTGSLDQGASTNLVGKKNGREIAVSVADGSDGTTTVFIAIKAVAK